MSAVITEADGLDPVQDFDVGARLRELRTLARLTQRELATRAGVAHGLISMIEQGRSSPSVASLRKILGGLPMTMADFFEPDRPSDSKVVFRPHELTDLTSQLYRLQGGQSGKISLRQVGHARAHNLQILHEHYEPGADTGPTMLEHTSHEGGVVISGELRLTVGDQAHTLKAGDAYLFDSRVPHRFENVSDRACVVVSACSPPYL